MDDQPVAGTSDLMRNVCFSEVSNLLENIRNAKEAQQKVAVWQKYFRKFYESHKDKVCPRRSLLFVFTILLINSHPHQTYSFYPFIRFMLPKIDRERESYGIQMSTLAQLYIRALNLNVKSNEAKSLTTEEGFTTNTRDYADVVYNVVKNRCQPQCTLSVQQVNAYLDEIANTNSRATMETVFTQLIKSTTAKDQKWIVRIILKKLNLGIAERRILLVYHSKAYSLYERMSHLTRVCHLVDTGQADTADVTEDVVAVFQPLRSMLCEQAQLNKLPGLLNNQTMYVELKMDGERFQIHKDGDQYRYFSRNGEYTENFGAKATGNCFSASLDRKLNVTVKSVILDGEMLVWDQVNRRFLAKGDHQDARNLKQDHKHLQVYCAFDLLLLNGQSLIGKPYLERIRLLEEQVVLVDEHVVVLCQRQRVDTVQQILDFFNAAIDRGEEGIILKGQDAPYLPGVRNSSGWFKLKPDYVEGLVNDLDLLIIGATRNAKGFVESFILGVAVKEVLEERGDPEENMTFQAVSTVRHGLKVPEWLQLNATLRSHWVRPEVEACPRYLEFGNCKPDYWIAPKHSMVLQVKATELNRSNGYRTQYTLRFPRITAIRSDKPWYECCLLSEYEQLVMGNGGNRGMVQKLARRHATVADVSVRRGGGGGKRRKIAPPTDFVFDDEQDEVVPVVDSVCKGLEFCILNTKRGAMSVQKLGQIVRRHEGVVVKNPGPTTFLCVAGDLIATVLGYAKTQLYDIVNVEWVVERLGGEGPLNELPARRPFDMVAMTVETRARFKLEFDSHNDSFVEDIRDEAEFEQVLAGVKYECYERLLEREVVAFEEEHLLEDADEEGDGKTKVQVNLFSQFLAFFMGEHQGYLEVVFRSRRGIIVEEVEEATHVFVAERVQWKLPEDAREDVKLMDSAFIMECIREGRVVDEGPYLIEQLQ